MKISMLKNLCVVTVLLATLMFSYSTPSGVMADVLSDRINDVANADDEGSFTQGVLNLAIPVSVFALVGLSAYAGFLMITSQGDPEKLGQAREVFTNAVLGFCLIALSVVVLVIIQNLLNLPGVNP